MTNFYVCAVRTSAESWHWHAGITDKSHYKKRCSAYFDCILWEEFSTRIEAAAFEETCNFYSRKVLTEVRENAGGHPNWADDCPSEVPALVLSAFYENMLSLWKANSVLARNYLGSKITRAWAAKQRENGSDFLIQEEIVDLLSVARDKALSFWKKSKRPEPMWS